MMTLHIGELIKSSGLYREAFTHKSLSKEANFERLEFLGDSLVGALVTELLLESYPKTSEGDLSRWKSTLIGQASLAEICRQLKLQDHLICKASERGALMSNERIQASLFEAFLGAYYLENDYEKLKAFVAALFKEKISTAEKGFETTDYKTLFQEAAQRELSQTPTYQTLEKTGPSHNPYFKVAVCIEGEVFAKGNGESIKGAQRSAAQKAMTILYKSQTTTKEETKLKTGENS